MTPRENRANCGDDGIRIPFKPTVTAKNADGFPIHNLVFLASPFADPQGAETFGALKWRVAEVTDPTAPAYIPEADPIHEWNATWTTGEITTFTNEIRIPPTAVQPGHAYRVRVRMKDNTGRWGHWSSPIQFIPRLTAIVSPGDIVITEFFANTAGADDNREWFEIFNKTDRDIDITGWTIADNETDSHTLGGARPVIVPAKGCLVLGGSTSASTNGGAPVDYAYGSDITLGNSSDEIILLAGGTVIHSIGYGSYKAMPHAIVSNAGPSPVQGIATGMALDYCHGPVSAWALQTTTYGTLGNQGTPGAHNSGVAVCQSVPPRFLAPPCPGTRSFSIGPAAAD